MKIEAVTVCVNYADFLAHTIVWNKPCFDRWVIVTDSEDQRTRDICEHHHVECVTTDSFYSGDRAFAKACGINFGLSHLQGDGWFAHLDADIVLPPRARQLIEQTKPDPRTIYGVDRVMCYSYEDWARYQSWPEVQHSCNLFVQATDFELGTRVGHLDEDGWAPIGFFQLWHPSGSGHAAYPDQGNGDRSDLKFARNWPREHRGMIPEVVAIHLDSEKRETMGGNWRGRKTKHFGPKPLPRPLPPVGDHKHIHHHHHHYGEEE